MQLQLEVTEEGQQFGEWGGEPSEWEECMCGNQQEEECVCTWLLSAALFSAPLWCFSRSLNHVALFEAILERGLSAVQHGANEKPGEL